MWVLSPCICTLSMLTSSSQTGISKEATAASFIRPIRMQDERRSFIEALRYKYASEHTDIVFQNGRPADKAIQISGKEVEEVGFEKIRKQQAGLHELKIVLLDGLCVHEPLGLEANGSVIGIDSHQNALPEVLQVCPKIVELDLSRNLLTHWEFIAAICEQLLKLKSLRLDGNRINSIDFDRNDRPFFKRVFGKIITLSLEENLLTWEQAVKAFTMFPALETLSLSKNCFGTLTKEPSFNEARSISTLTLESNNFTTISDLAPLTCLPNLKKLILKKNNIATLGPRHSTEPAPIFPASLTDLDLSHNSISKWTLVNDLSTTFPGLSSLRIAHNPLFANLQAPDGRFLTPDDGYLLVTARLPNLKSLNYSSISSKDAMNAASYYLSLIAMELSFAQETETETIKKSHPRWVDLCEEYGEPVIRRSSSNINPRFMAAQLLTLNVYLTPGAIEKSSLAGKKNTKYTFEFPKSLSVYAVLGRLGKYFGLSPMNMELVWETSEWDVAAARANGEDGLWDSEEEEEDDNVTSMGKKREVEVTAGTKGIGDWIEGSEAKMRIGLRDRRDVAPRD